MFEEIRPHEPPNGRPKRKRRIQNGREGRTAKKVSPVIKGRFAVVGLLLCLTLGALAWRADLYWLAIPLLVLAAWALADAIWQWHKLHQRHPGHHA